ncbi:MAG: phosphoribosylaminoimidazolesuccinocarboxamide synthase, partial [Actinobacteria bacterium]|nr:phosphoribosylaminoimidazolesuccinocarboxamide synthase [Actinomycetota bacterium]
MIGWTPLKSGKVRDLYVNDVGEILLVASDRISAYDWIMPTPIPDKGRLLTELSLFWFEKLRDVVPNHVLSTQVPVEVKGRAIICKPLEIFPVECVARGYLTGSGWQEYQQERQVCGISLPAGLLDGSELPEPIFTPATKAEVGEHDQNISFEVSEK